MEKGDLVASVLQQPDGSVVLTWCHADRVAMEDWSTVGEAKHSVEETCDGLIWQEARPGEWLAKASWGPAPVQR